MYTRDPYDTVQPPCVCPLDSPHPITTEEYCPAHGDPKKAPQLEPDETDFGAEAYSEHLEEAHGGGECDCPPPPPIEPARPGDPDYATEPPF